MTPYPVKQVILADDHNVVRRGLAALLTINGGYTVIAEASDGQELVELAEKHVPDIIILDLSMPRLNGLGSLIRLRSLGKKTALMVLSMYDDEELIIQAFRNGADGYLLKDSMEDELFEALHFIQQGQRYLSRSIDPSILDETPSLPTFKLTSREYEVLQLICSGYTAVEIADLMCISPHTANRHRANLMQKMGVRNQVELMRLAIQRGLIVLENRPLSVDSSTLPPKPL